MLSLNKRGALASSVRDFEGRPILVVDSLSDQDEGSSWHSEQEQGGPVCTVISAGGNDRGRFRGMAR